ncbi:hypothetical protein [Longispora sp. NPDC051575]|uniref:hypothetical protein n=1 Tax=Longispora sp. NPDC051575 TaxID=3154943 RepID=UPI003429AAEF
MATTATALGTLDTVSNGPRDAILGLALDGIVHWMTPGEGYRLHHDGLDWRVTGGRFHGAVLTRAGQPVFRLPTQHGDEPLSVQHAYTAQLGPDGQWELWRLNW